jgi:pimeloyl-ACP methyl ester carboxylesterase
MLAEVTRSVVEDAQIRYVENDGAHIAWTEFGEGEIDIVLVWGFLSHLELAAGYPPVAKFLARLASIGRVINFDRRGIGLSDPVAGAPTLEQRVDDTRAVMDAAGSERAAIFGFSEGGAASILLAASHPDRVTALVLYGALARATRTAGYEFGNDPDALAESGAELILPHWGEGAIIEVSIPSQAANEQARSFQARLERSAASPGTLSQLAAMFVQVDVREAARAIRVPTLVLHREHDMMVDVRHGRWLAENIEGAELVELPGRDHAPWFEEPERLLGEVEVFLTGRRTAPEPERALATVLFTDIVDSTQRAAQLGDAAWRQLLEDHQAAIRAELDRAGGREIKTTGDGFLATFDGPAKGVRCAQAIVERCAELGAPIRAGLHTGECELMGDDVGGIAVHIAARVSARAGEGEVLVSRTVTDLVAGSGLEFENRGDHELKGVPGEWRLLLARPA